MTLEYRLAKTTAEAKYARAENYYAVYILTSHMLILFYLYLPKGKIYSGSEMVIKISIQLILFSHN